jgi:hypothetical protein
MVLPRNIPALSVSSEKNYSCSVLQLCIYSMVLLLILGIISMLVFIGNFGEALHIGEWRWRLE